MKRRQFLQAASGATGAVAVLGLGTPLPNLLTQAALAAEGADNDHVLVVLQLSGGNDGLNTVVPFRNDDYYRARPTLAIGESRVLKLNDDLGLHPAMNGLAEQFKQGRVAVVQGVGYENPNRSHFESMDIWHSCRRKNEPRPTGWLGRCFDELGSQQGDVPGMHLGDNKQPFALTADKVRAPSLGNLDQFQLKGVKSDLVEAVVRSSAKPSESGSLLSFIQSNTSSALDASQRVREAVKNYQSKIEYPESVLGRKLQTVAQLIGAGLKTKVYYVELDGFDTHSQQEGAHTSLVRKWSSAVDAFLRDLEAQGSLDRMLMMCFSEFGRRVKENGSKGTDHGAAAPAFLVGGKVKGGVHGKHPSLSDLTQGDLKFHTDFRRVYATVLEKWLGVASDKLLYGHYPPLDVI